MENYNENYNFTPSPEIVRYESHRELSNLTKNYWQVADETNLKNVQGQISEIIEPVLAVENTINNPETQDNFAREIMLDDLEKMINNYSQKSSFFKLFKQ